MPQPTRISRRRALQSGAAALLAAGLWPGALRAAERDAAAGGAFRFICVNDLHCMDDESGAWLESNVVRVMKQTKEPIDFCHIVGDLSDTATAHELAIVRDLFKTLGVPVHVTPGNHDHTANDDRSAYDDLFPKTLNYTFEHKGWQFVSLDSTQGHLFQRTSIKPDTFAWLDANLPKLDRTKPTTILTHFPMGETVTNRPVNADDLLARFKDYNLQAVLNGHYHAFTERHLGRATLTTNRCCALKRFNHDKSKEKGYFVCEVKDGALARTFVEVVVPPAPRAATKPAADPAARQ